MTKINLHTQLLNEVLVQLCQRPYIRAWKNQVGVGEMADGSIVRFGVNGAADITGILRTQSGYGIRLEIEIKTGSGRQSPAQKNYQHMIESLGGLYFLARNVHEVIEFCERKAREL